MKSFIMTADKAMGKLKEGNKKYLDSETEGAISQGRCACTPRSTASIPMRLL